MNRFLNGVARAFAETFDLPGPILEIGSYQVPGQEEIADLHFVTSFPVKGANLIILKDVTRSGIVESYLLNQLREEKPRSVRFASLVDRPQERQRAIRTP